MFYRNLFSLEPGQWRGEFCCGWNQGKSAWISALANLRLGFTFAEGQWRDPGVLSEVCDRYACVILWVAYKWLSKYLGLK